MNRKLNIIITEGSITITSVSTKSLCVKIVKRRAILPRGVTNMINQGHANCHILTVHTILGNESTDTDKEAEYGVYTMRTIPSS